MNTFLFMVFLLAIGLLVFAAVARKRSSQSTSSFVDKPKARPPLTVREQAMYNRLVETLPETLPDLVVLPQVSFGALLTARTRAARSSFSRKIADFVVCDRACKAIRNAMRCWWRPGTACCDTNGFPISIASKPISIPRWRQSILRGRACWGR